MNLPTATLAGMQHLPDGMTLTDARLFGIYSSTPTRFL
jgi:hypothetical protein